MRQNWYPSFGADRLSLLGEEFKMTGKLDWKWIVIGVAIMVLLNISAALVLGFVLGPQPTSPEDISFSGGQILLAVAINFLSFVIGGFVVGIRSAGRTILEPGISALIAVLIALGISRQLTVTNLIIGGLVPFAAGVLGGWLGERRQATVS
jgi:hypothetical protein